MKAWYVASVGALSMLPFLAVHLTRAGLSDGQAAWALAALPVGTLIGGPLWAAVVDRWGRARWVHRASLLLTALCVLAFLLPLNGAGLAVLMVAFAFARSGVFPFADAATVHAVGPRYGTIRGIGSLGYIAGILVIGRLAEGVPDVPILVGALGLLTATALSGALPTLPEDVGLAGDPWAPLREPVVRAVLLVGVLNGLSITAYDHLFALHMERIGVSTGTTSLAIAWGVLVEVVVMALGSRVLARFGSSRLLVLAVATGIPRFLLTAWLGDPRLVALLQGLHGFQFGLFWIAAVDQLGRAAPPGLRSSTQALLPAAAFGIAPLTILLVGGTWLQAGSTRVLFGGLTLPALLATLAALRLLRLEAPVSPFR